MPVLSAVACLNISGVNAHVVAVQRWLVGTVECSVVTVARARRSMLSLCLPVLGPWSGVSNHSAPTASAEPGCVRVAAAAALPPPRGVKTDGRLATTEGVKTHERSEKNMYCVNVSVHAHRRAVRKGGLCRALAHRTRASPRLTLTRSERLSATCLLASYGERLHLSPLLTRRREQTSILAPD